MIVKLHDETLKTKIKSANDAYTILRKTLLTQDAIDQDKEHMIVLGLMRNNNIKFIDIVSIGTLTGTLVHPREIFRRAIIHAVSSIIVAHNHPSGNKQPSQEDIVVTKKLREAGKIIEIELTDHIIFTHEEFYSFANEGML